jgi:predicted membrane metal-binding protein
VHFLTITGILIHLIIGIALILWGKQFSKFIGKINPGAVTLAQRLQLLQKAKKPGIKNSKEIEQG